MTIMEDKTLIILAVGALSLIFIMIISVGAIAMITPSAETQIPDHTTTPPVILISGVFVNSSDGKISYVAKPDGSISIMDNTRIDWQTWNIPITRNSITNLKLIDNETKIVVTDNLMQTYTLNLTNKQLITVTNTPTPTPIIKPTATLNPTPDMTGTDRFVVITTPTPIPDEKLEIMSIETPEVFVIGDEATVTLNLKNTGSADLTDLDLKVTIYDYINGKEPRKIFSQIVPGIINIKADKTKFIPITRTVPNTWVLPGNNTVAVLAKPYQVVVEIRSSNTSQTLDEYTVNVKVARHSIDGYGITFD